MSSQPAACLSAIASLALGTKNSALGAPLRYYLHDLRHVLSPLLDAKRGASGKLASSALATWDRPLFPGCSPPATPSSAGIARKKKPRLSSSAVCFGPIRPAKLRAHRKSCSRWSPTPPPFARSLLAKTALSPASANRP